MALEFPFLDNPSCNYAAMMDSVNLINSVVPETAEDFDCLDRNVRHLELMLERDWDGYDLDPINAAIQAGKEKQNPQEPS